MDARREFRRRARTLNGMLFARCVSVVLAGWQGVFQGPKRIPTMRKIFGLAGGFVLAASSFTNAQVPQPVPAQVPQPATITTAPATVAETAQVPGGPMQVRRVSQLIGSNVHLQGTNNYGKVEDVVLNENGTPGYLVVANNNKYAMLPWNAAHQLRPTYCPLQRHSAGHSAAVLRCECLADRHRSAIHQPHQSGLPEHRRRPSRSVATRRGHRSRLRPGSDSRHRHDGKDQAERHGEIKQQPQP